MKKVDPPNLRDFVYLDVERVKSLLAQLERGLLTDRAESSGSSKGVEGNVGGSIPGLLQIGGAGNYVSSNQSTETRTLHDFVFNYTEERLIQLGRVKRLPEDFTGALLLNNDVRAGIAPVEYVVVRGRLYFSDYGYLQLLLENINDLLKITTRFSYHDQIKATTGKEKAAITQEMNQRVNATKLDESYVRDLRSVFEIFLKDRLAIRILPFPEDPSLRIVGPLQPALLRERLEDIRYKFGSSPSAEWTVFGQIAAVPKEKESREVQDLAFSNELDKALETLFDSIREIEDQFRVTYPEIAITPIAIYRD